MQQNSTNLRNHFKRMLRLIVIVGDNSILDDASELANEVVTFPTVKSLTHQKLNYLRADLLVVNKSIEPSAVILKRVVQFIHEGGSLLLPQPTPAIAKSCKVLGLHETDVPHLFTKSVGYTPKEYGTTYIERWGDTDFMKNWKLAGQQILEHIPHNFNLTSMKVLDVGCLNGYIMESVRRSGVTHVYGTDISYEIAINRTVNPDLLPSITICDFVNNTYPENFAEVTICMEVLEHIPPENTDRFIAELARVTTPGGVVLISTSEDWDVDPTHLNCRKRPEWYGLFKKNNLVPYGEQIIFSGFNSFVVRKPVNTLQALYLQSIYQLSRLVPLWSMYRLMRRSYRRIYSTLRSRRETYQKSYAQSGEDMIVKFIFDTIGNNKPSYIDIGAHHPYRLSNTALLYSRGSRGINIEPDPELFRAFRTYRPYDVNLNIGVAAKSGRLDLYLMNPSSLNTFSKEEAKKYSGAGSEILATKKIPVDTLSHILAKYNDRRFPDFLSLDVEGLDFEILKTIDYDNQAPTVICIETISYSIHGEGVKDTGTVRFLETKGYMVYADTYINTIFVKRSAWLR